MPDIQKIEAVAKHKATYQHDLKLAQTAIDKAADAGKMTEVKTLQSEIAGLTALIESCDRRIEKLQQETTEEEKQARRNANDAAFAGYRNCSSQLVPKARRIMQAAATLAAELKSFHLDADQAGGHYIHLARQLNGRERETAQDFLGTVRFIDGALGVALSEELRKLGVFNTLAPTARLELQRYDLPAMDEVVETRNENLADRVAQIYERANAAI